MSRTLVASALLATALAGLPQPMCVYYGQAQDGYGFPYTTNATVVLLHGTNEVASHSIRGSLSPGVNFALYVHIDDGSAAQAYSPRALRSGELVRLLPEWHFDAGAVWLYYPSKKLLPAKTRVFIDFVLERFRRERFAERMQVA